MLSQHIHNKSTKFRVSEVRSSVESSSESNSNFKSQMILTIHFSDLVNKRSEKFRFRLIKQHSKRALRNDYLEKGVTTDFMKFKKLALDAELIYQFIAGVRSIIQQKLIIDIVINMEIAERESRDINSTSIPSVAVVVRYSRDK